MINDKYYTQEEEYHIEEEKSHRGSSLRQETELYNDDDNIVHKLISIKRVEVGHETIWEVYEDKKLALNLKGVRFTAAERAFLNTSEGMRFIIDGAKSGWNSVSEFKRQIKRYMK